MLLLNHIQIRRVVREAQPENTKFHEMVDAMVHDSRGYALGYSVTELVCSFCGAESRTVHPVPLQFPAECGECGRKACYEKVYDDSDVDDEEENVR